MNTIWLVLLIGLAIIEALTMGLTTIWFAGGALVAFIVSTLGGPIWLQMIAFVVVSFILLIFTRPFAVKYINKQTVKTNIDDVIGKTAKVKEVVDNINATGHVLLNGQEWTARSSKEDVVIPEDTLVIVERIEGVKLIVKKKEEVTK